MSNPTYKDLIELLNEAEADQDKEMSTAELLTARFSQLYPHITVSRPTRFLATVRQINGPIGSGRLKGSSRKLYLKRIWTPRIRNTGVKRDCVRFPDQLASNYGLTMEVLSNAFESGEAFWSLHEVPNVEFYRKLHHFLKVWDVTRSLTKTAIGKFYLEIDSHLRDRRSTPYNTYRFIEQMVSSNIPDSAPMSYGFKKCEDEMQHCNQLVEDLTIKVKEQQDEMDQLKHDLHVAKKDLMNAESSVQKMAAERLALQRHQVALQKKLHGTLDKYESTLNDFFHIEDELLAKNLELIESLNEMTSTQLSSQSDRECLVKFAGQTKNKNKAYSDHVRELYYSLLADQIPPGKLDKTIASVLKCFLPSVDTESIKLPREKCATYMRREELNTVSTAHKAYAAMEFKSVHLNSDGTTKFQKKLGGVAMNDMVFSLTEVPDGSADSMIKQISCELGKIREIAYALKLPNPEKINFTLFVSSTSDSASSQKRFNCLLEKLRREDEEKYGPVCPDAVELIENLCAMHLGSS